MHVVPLADLLTALGRLTTALVVDLDDAEWHLVDLDAVRRHPGVLVGRATRALPEEARPVIEAFTTTIAPSGPGRAWVSADLGPIETTVAASPRAASSLATLLPVTASLEVEHGLVAESLAYSMLLASEEFVAWRARTPVRVVPEPTLPVQVTRDGDRLVVTLNRPVRRNAFGRAVRDALLEALTVAEMDPAIATVVLRGAGPSFCSGGDLDEFGTAGDVAGAHVVRLAASAGAAVYRLRDRVRPQLHGACVGAGIEVPAFAAHVVAAPDAWFQLPELSMGLVPGAGGTVSITRRIGRWRTAWLALSGARLDAQRALDWGLVDELGR